MKKAISLMAFSMAVISSFAQTNETLQSVTDRGATTTNPINIAIGGGALIKNNPGGWSTENVLSRAWDAQNGDYTLLGVAGYEANSANLIINKFGNVGIGTTTISNQQGWQKVLDVHGDVNAKLLVTSNSVQTGIFSHNNWGTAAGRIGTESAHPLYLMAGYGNDALAVLPNANVGIGTTSPAYKLDVNGMTSLGGHSANVDGYSLAGLQGSGKVLIAWNRSSGNGETDIISNRGAGSQGGFCFYDLTNDGVLNPLVNIKGTGDLFLSGHQTIGSTNNQKNLEVNGNIKTRKVKVTQTDWADYVFDSLYQLNSLSQVEQFIQQNKHLPDVPSAAEVKKEGIDLGDNQALLLKKIEELTLYIIQQHKKMEQVEKRLADIEAKNAESK